MRLIKSEGGIRTDAALVLEILKEIVLWILLFVPYLFMFLFYWIFTSDKNKSADYFQRVFLEPLKLFYKVWEWFFEAKYTAGVILFLIFIYIVEIVFLLPYIDSLMFNPVHIFNGNYWSVLTSIFLHADLSHLFGNCLVMLIFGRIVERRIGVKMLMLLILSGLFANFVSGFISYWNSDFFSSLGASGAISGIVIFAIMFSPFAFTYLLVIPLPVFLVGWMYIYSDVVGLFNPSNINHYAHLGGYLSLIVVMFALSYNHRKEIVKGMGVNLGMLLLFFLFNIYWGWF